MTLVSLPGCGLFPTPVRQIRGWAVGSLSRDGYGVIVRTDDSGETWTRQGSSADIPDTGLSFVLAQDKNVVWVVGWQNDGYGTILKSTDAGMTWRRLGDASTIPDVTITKIAALDSSHLWAVGDGGTILKTSDGGETWTRQGEGAIPDVLIQGLAVVDANDIWVTGNVDSGYGTIYHTADGGATWQRQGSAETIPNAMLLSVGAADAGTAWVIGQAHGYILKTINGGLTWQDQTPESMGDANHILVYNRITAWVVEDNGLFHTIDGNTWQPQTLPASVSGIYILGICGVDAYHLWACGASMVPTVGALLRTADGGLNWELLPQPFDIGWSSVSFVDWEE